MSLAHTIFTEAFMDGFWLGFIICGILAGAFATWILNASGFFKEE